MDCFECSLSLYLRDESRSIPVSSWEGEKSLTAAPSRESEMIASPGSCWEVRLSRSTIGGGRRCNKFVPVLGGDGTRMAPLGDLYNQSYREMS